MDEKELLAKNLIRYRKTLNLTQAELAEKLNYSDKAVSKWERGESTPDIFVLKQIADFYGVKIDDFFCESQSEVAPVKKHLGKKRIIISLIAVLTVWLVAVIAFFTVSLIIPAFSKTWVSFLYALVISLVVLLVLTSVWGKNFWNMIFVSLFIWSLITAVYFTWLYLSPLEYLWLMYIIGIPLQFIVVFWFLYKKVK